MAKITNLNNHIEFELSNETHLIAKTNLKYIRLDEYIAFLDNSDRQRNDKRFLLKYDEIDDKSFQNGGEFVEWIKEIVCGETEAETNARETNENTRELRIIKGLLKELLAVTKKIYSPV